VITVDIPETNFNLMAPKLSELKQHFFLDLVI
jgi:hypothetical protein